MHVTSALKPSVLELFGTEINIKFQNQPLLLMNGSIHSFPSAVGLACISRNSYTLAWPGPWFKWVTHLFNYTRMEASQRVHRWKRMTLKAALSLAGLGTRVHMERKAEPQKKNVAARDGIGSQLLTNRWQENKKAEVSVYKSLDLSILKKSECPDTVPTSGRTIVSLRQF